MKSLNPTQVKLIVCASAIVVGMLIVVPLVTSALSPLTGYLCVFAIYWTCCCIPLAAKFRDGNTNVSLGLRNSPIWVPIIAIILPIAVSFGAGTFEMLDAQINLIALAVLCALINGPLEELAWRRTFRANSEGSMVFEMVGLGLFTLWHVALYQSQGIAFDHGALGLIGGAFGLALVWTFLTRTNNSVGWPMLSHALVNTAGFIPLFVTNFGN